MSSLKKEWEKLARRHLNEEIAGATKRFRDLLATRDLGFLELDAVDGAEFEDFTCLVLRSKELCSRKKSIPMKNSWMPIRITNGLILFMYWFFILLKYTYHYSNIIKFLFGHRKISTNEKNSAQKRKTTKKFLSKYGSCRLLEQIFLKIFSP